MKLIGLAMTLLGWLLPVAALSMTQSTTARMIITLLGIAVSLVGILVVLNKVHLKTAIWKL
jgi:hypothetical protein